MLLLKHRSSFGTFKDFILSMRNEQLKEVENGNKAKETASMKAKDTRSPKTESFADLRTTKKDSIQNNLLNRINVLLLQETKSI